MNVEVRSITADDWALVRDVSFRALADSPDAFRRTLAEAQALTEDLWRQRAEGQHRSWCWWCPLSSCWQQEVERGVAGFAVDGDGAVVRVGDGRDDGQAETGASGRARAVASGEPLEQGG